MDKNCNGKLLFQGLAKPVTKESSQPEVQNQPVIKPVAQENQETTPKRKREENVKSTLPKKKTKKSVVETSKVSLIVV